MEKEVVLKKAIIGGFDCRQVIEYIEYLKTRQVKSAADTAQLQSLRSQLEDLQAILASKDEEIAELSAKMEKYAGNTRLAEVSTKLIRESTAYADSYIEGVKVLAKNLNDSTNAKIDFAKRRVDEMLRAIEEISDSVTQLYSIVSELRSDYEIYGNACEGADIFVEPVILTGNTVVEDKDSDILDESQVELVELIESLKLKYRSMVENSK